VLRGETEAVLEQSVQLLGDYYGNQISVGERTLMVTQGDLTGGLRDLAMAVLAEGEEL